jgi:hypothetical protein
MGFLLHLLEILTHKTGCLAIKFTKICLRGWRDFKAQKHQEMPGLITKEIWSGSAGAVLRQNTGN